MNNIITVFLLLPPLAIFLHYTGGEGHTDMRSTGECLGTAVVTSLAGHCYYWYSTIITIMADKLVVGWFRLDEDDNNNKK